MTLLLRRCLRCRPATAVPCILVLATIALLGGSSALATTASPRDRARTSAQYEVAIKRAAEGANNVGGGDFVGQLNSALQVALVTIDETKTSSHPPRRSAAARRRGERLEHCLAAAPRGAGRESLRGSGAIWCKGPSCACKTLSEIVDTCALEAADLSRASVQHYRLVGGEVGRPWYCAQLTLPKKGVETYVKPPLPSGSRRNQHVKVSAIESNSGSLYAQTSSVVDPPPRKPRSHFVGANCECLTKCMHHRTQPQDPLPWCYTHPSCLHASRVYRRWEDEGFREICHNIATKKPLSPNVSSCTQVSSRTSKDLSEMGDALTGPRDVGSVAWRHCGSADNGVNNNAFWEWPTPSPAGMLRAEEAQRASKKKKKKKSLTPLLLPETCCNPAWTGGETKQCSMCASPAHMKGKPARYTKHGACESPEAYAQSARHYFYQAPCAPDGLGSNSNTFKVQAAIALRLHMKLIWNQALFISENTPQYVDAHFHLQRSLDDAPGDLFHPLGLGLCAPAAPGNGAVPSAAVLFEKIEKGELIPHVVDDVKFVEIADAIDWIDRVERNLIESQAWVSGKEHVIILRSGCQEVLSWSSYNWWGKVYAQGRRVYRPTMPVALQPLPRHAFAVVVHVRWGDIGILPENEKILIAADSDLPSPIPFAVYTKMLTPLFTKKDQAGKASKPLLTCANAHVIFVAEADERDRNLIRSELQRGEYAKCSSFVFEGITQQDGPASARGVFDALDLFADADVLVGGGRSQFTRLAAALGTPSGVRIMHNADTDWFAGMENVVAPCNDGFVDKDVLANVWYHRREMHRGFIKGCKRVPPANAAKGTPEWWARKFYDETQAEEKAMALETQAMEQRVAARLRKKKKEKRLRAQLQAKATTTTRKRKSSRWSFSGFF